MDESPWLVQGVKEWMWVISSEKYSLFHAGDTRSRAKLEYLLGQSFSGVLSSDDFSVYNSYRVVAQQKCLAHLQPHFQQVTRLKQAHQKALGEAFLSWIDEAFTQHSGVKLLKHLLMLLGPNLSRCGLNRQFRLGVPKQVM